MFMDENLSSRPKAIPQMQDPILYVGKFEHELTKFIHDYGDYLYMVFAWCCLFIIAWLVFRKRKAPPPKVWIIKETREENRFARN